MVMRRNADVRELDPRPLRAQRDKPQDERRVDIVFAKTCRTPCLHDQAAGHCMQHTSLQKAAERAELRAAPGTDDDFAAGDRGMGFGVEVHPVQGSG